MKDLKLGQNKGNARIYVEIKESEPTYKVWAQGNRYNREVTEDTIILSNVSDGKYVVSGKPRQGIIDLNGKWLTKWGDIQHRNNNKDNKGITWTTYNKCTYLK